MSDSSHPTRREIVGWLASLPFAAAIAPAAAAAAAVEGRPFAPRFFTAHQWRTVRALADHVIPRDERSGSATDAGVPEFMDFMMADHMTDHVGERTTMRGGLHWLDSHCRDRFGAAFIDCAPGQQTAVLDDIAWHARARPDMSQGVAFFTFFRNLTASGFWTSRIGIADLRYVGNTVVHEWTGCPDAALAKLGVSY
jgi:gluconate 2-dehydrogenase subunit 3-like protein